MPPNVYQEIFSQSIRVKRICTYPQDFHKHCEMLTGHFIRRGYPPEDIKDAYEQAFSMDRETLLQPKPKKEQQDVLDKHILIITYSPGLKTAGEVIEKHWPILGASNATSDLYNTSVIYGHRRARNVRDMIICAKLPQIRKKNRKNSQKNVCKTKKCRSILPQNQQNRQNQRAISEKMAKSVTLYRLNEGQSFSYFHSFF